MTVSAHDVTQYLQEFAAGDANAFDEVMSRVYGDLHGIAERQLRRVRFGETLDTTVLVHEAYLKLSDQRPTQWKDRRHFFAISAYAMRQIIVDNARRRSAQKRGGGEAPECLDENHAPSVDRSEGVLELKEALESLGEIDEKLKQVVECRFFAGFSERETAEALGVSVTTVQRLWRRAKIWLKSELAN